MKNAYYFPHDLNAIQDPKMMSLLAKVGLSGIGFYWIIVEILHQQQNGAITVEQFSSYLKLYSMYEDNPEQMSDKMEQVLFKCGLLIEQDGEIYSNRVLDNKAKMAEVSRKRSEAGKLSAEKRRNQHYYQ